MKDRDLKKIAAAGHRKLEANSKRDLNVIECRELIKESGIPVSDELFYLISNVYAIGFEEGYRAKTANVRKAGAVNG